MRVRLLGWVLVLILTGCTGGAPETRPQSPGAAPEPLPAVPQPPPVPTQPPAEPEAPPKPAEPPPPAPKPRVTVWAVDTTGTQAPELLFEREERLQLEAISPDGRYWLFLQIVEADMALIEGYMVLLDRQTGQLRQGPAPKDWPRNVTWSGDGFWINRLVHLDLNLELHTYPELRMALELGRDRWIMAADWSADGQKVALAIRDQTVSPWGGHSVDLVMASPDGRVLTRIPRALQPYALGGKAGGVIRLAMAPDGERLVVSSQSPGEAMVSLADPRREAWQPLITPFRPPVALGQDEGGVLWEMVWSPDGRHVWVSPSYILNRAGEIVAEVPGPIPPAVWTRDSSAIVVRGEPGKPELRLITLAGEVRSFASPDSGVRMIDFLPDGRLLVAHTVLP